MKKTRIQIGASVLWNALPCQIKKARPINCFKTMKKNSYYAINVIINYCFVHSIYKLIEHAALARYFAI